MLGLTIPERIFFFTKEWVNAPIYVGNKNSAIVFRKQFTITAKNNRHELIPITISLILEGLPVPRITFFSVYDYMPRIIGSIYCTSTGKCVYETVWPNTALCVHDQCVENVYFKIAFTHLLRKQAA